MGKIIVQLPLFITTLKHSRIWELHILIENKFPFVDLFITSDDLIDCSIFDGTHNQNETVRVSFSNPEPESCLITLETRRNPNIIRQPYGDKFINGTVLLQGRT